MNSVLTGRQGETLAIQYLEELGHTVVEKNFSARGGEIDIIYRDGVYTVFCEVKYRRGSRYGSPSEAVDETKMKKICKAAKLYAYKNGLLETPLRFDVLEILDHQINLIKNAFMYLE